jgi:hypothetical protein
MVVLDTLSGHSGPVGERWNRLLTTNGVPEQDATIIYRLRCSLLHGYGPPKKADACNRHVLLTPDVAGFAVDTRRPGLALVSVHVFCGYLVERIVNHARYESAV